MQINALPHADAGFSSGSRQGSSACFPGTRMKVLKDIYEWIDDPDPNMPRICLVNGLAGIGKAILAQSVGEPGREEKKLGASFFFARGVEERSDALRLFSTIAYQFTFFNAEFKAQLVRI